MRRWARAGGARSAASGEDGSATLYAVAAMVMVTAVAVGVSFLVTAAATRHRASGAADLAALAGAAASATGATQCAAAASIAMRNGAELTECVVTAGSVTVGVTVRAPRFFGIVLQIPGRARAG